MRHCQHSSTNICQKSFWELLMGMSLCESEATDVGQGVERKVGQTPTYLHLAFDSHLVVDV
jgi:hypothetical protein